MLHPTYKEAVSRAFKLTWENKILWIFGLISVFLGQFGLSGFLGHLLQQANGVFWPSWIFGISIPNVQTALGLIWVGGIMIGIGILVMLAGVISQAALIYASAEAYAKNGKVSVGTKLWHRGVDHFWPLFLANILRHLLLFSILCLSAFLWIKIGATTTLASGLLSIAILTLEFLAAVIIMSVFIYSAGYIVIDKKNLGAAIKKGWNLFSKHPLVSLELSLLLIIINLGLLALTLAGLTVLLLPSLITSLIFGFTGYTFLLTAGAASGIILFLLFFALIGGFYNAFATGAWTYLFIKMHKEGIVSHIISRWLKK